MKKLIVFFLCSFLSFEIFAQSRINANYNVAYRNAQESFEGKNYGKALKYAEDAVLYKKQNVDKEIKRLESSLSAREVKAVGDRISAVLKILNEREEYDCIDIVNYYVGLKGSSYFHYSIKELMNYIREQEFFPEAEILIGEIYKLEGEYEYAENYFKKALDHAEVLDIPDEKYAILYTMADLSRLSGDYAKMEQRLLNITGKVPLQRRNTMLKSMTSTITRNRNDSLEKFFQMYRMDDYYCLNAYCLLSDYYASVNEDEKALGFSALAVITGFSKMDEIISKRDLDYEYTNLTDFLVTVQNYSDLVDWGSENNIWKSFNNLCNLSSKVGCNNFSRELLKILAKNSPSEYWQKAAVLKLDSLDGVN